MKQKGKGFIYLYGLADGTLAMIPVIYNSYWSLFLTSVAGLDAVGNAKVLSIIGIADVISILLVSFIVQKCNLKFGKFRFWVLLGGIGAAVTRVIAFTPLMLGSVGYFAAMAVISSSLYNLAYCAYMGMIPLIADSPENRMTTVTAQQQCVAVASIFVSLISNVPMIIYLAGSICKIVGSIGLTMLVSYYYTYAYGDMSMLTVYLTLSTVLQLIGATLAPVVNKIVKGNRNTFATGMFIYAACLALAFVTGKGSALIFTVFLAVGYMGWAITHTADAAYYSYIGDLVEYKHHKNIQPFLMSMLSMVIKIGIVVSNMVVGWGLVAVGFDANNVTEAAKTGIMNLTVLLPCAVLILGGIITLFSPLNDRKVREIKEELDKRHTA